MLGSAQGYLLATKHKMCMHNDDKKIGYDLVIRILNTAQGYLLATGQNQLGTKYTLILGSAQGYLSATEHPVWVHNNDKKIWV